MMTAVACSGPYCHLKELVSVVIDSDRVDAPMDRRASPMVSSEAKETKFDGRENLCRRAHALEYKLRIKESHLSSHAW